MKVLLILFYRKEEISMLHEVCDIQCIHRINTIVKIYITFYEKEQNLSQICLFLMIVVQMTPSHYLYKIHFCELFPVCETLDINLTRTPGLWTITQYD